MKKLLIAGVGVLSAALVIGPAIAADMEIPKRQRQAAPAQPQQASNNWTGGQAGVSNGGSSVNNNFVEPGAHNYLDCGLGCTPYETPFSFGGSKVTYIFGGFLGYRVQLGNIVVGAEGDVYWKNGRSSLTQTTTPPWLSSQTFNGEQKQGVDGSLRGRLGYLVTASTLLYGTGGLAIGKVSGSFSYTGIGTSLSPLNTVTGAASWDDTRVGYTVGGGLENIILPGVTVRVEYRYTDLGSYSKDVPLTNNYGCSSPTICGTNAHIDLRARDQRVTLGLGWDF